MKDQIGTNEHISNNSFLLTISHNRMGIHCSGAQPEDHQEEGLRRQFQVLIKAASFRQDQVNKSLAKLIPWSPSPPYGGHIQAHTNKHIDERMSMTTHKQKKAFVRS